jgi:uncharacterized repeat protein (TIGR01451 family)
MFYKSGKFVIIFILAVIGSLAMTSIAFAGDELGGPADSTPRYDVVLFGGGTLGTGDLCSTGCPDLAELQTLYRGDAVSKWFSVPNGCGTTIWGDPYNGATGGLSRTWANNAIATGTTIGPGAVGTVTLNAVSGLNYFNIYASDLTFTGIKGISITGPADATVIVNIIGQPILVGNWFNTVAGGGGVYATGVPETNIIWNAADLSPYPTAQSFTIAEANYHWPGSIVAPCGDVFLKGTGYEFHGQVIANTTQGPTYNVLSNQYNFTGNAPGLLGGAPAATGLNITKIAESDGLNLTYTIAVKNLAAIAETVVISDTMLMTNGYHDTVGSSFTLITPTGQTTGLTSQLYTAPYYTTTVGASSSITLVVTATVDAEITINKNPPTQEIDSGDGASFNVTIQNTGDVTLTNLVYVDTGATCTPLAATSLTPGSFALASCSQLSVTSSYTNFITVTADALVPNVAYTAIYSPALPSGILTGSLEFDYVVATVTVSDTDSADVIVLQDASVELTKTAAQIDSDTILYTIQVTNTGGSAASVLVTDTLPTGLTNVVCDGSVVADQGTFTRTITLTGNATKSYYCIADIDVTVDVQKTVQQTPILSNTAATFNITVTNSGSLTLTNLTVTDPKAVACSDTNVTLNPGAQHYDNCTIANVIAPETNVVTVTGSADIVNNASAMIVGDPATVVTTDHTTTININETAQATVNIYGLPGLELDKSARMVNDDIEYTIALTNTGTDPGTFLITDTFPAGLTNIRCDGVLSTTSPYTKSITLDGGTSQSIICTADTNISITVEKSNELQFINSDTKPTFDIDVTNNSPFTLTNILVTDPNTDCSGLIDELGAGNSVAFKTACTTDNNVTSTYTNTITATGHAVFTNTAEAMIVGDPTSVESSNANLDIEVTDTDTAVVKINPPGIAIDKQASLVDANTLQYDIFVTNTGNSPASYLITDTLPAGLTAIVCQLAPHTCSVVF